VFFEQPYPAYRSRKIFISVLRESGIFSVFDKGSSFDRLFPNQDYLSGKGFGNLIALPLHKQTWEKGNGCFIDPDTTEPINDQWKFIENIKKVSVQELDSIFEKLTSTNLLEENRKSRDANGNLTIRLSNKIVISRTGMSSELIYFLREELNFFNTAYIVKKQMSRNLKDIERYFRFIEDTEHEIAIPRGMAGSLLAFCAKHSIKYDFIDNRLKHDSIQYNNNLTLRGHQKSAIKEAQRKDFGVIVAPPGSGKTIIGLKIIAEKKQPALIIVHRKQIAQQWGERIEAFLGIPEKEIGKIGQGRTKIGKHITIAMIQSLAKKLGQSDIEGLDKAFGTILIDECQHVPAKTYRDTIAKLNTYYLYGLTATPFRKYNDGKLIFINIGKIISEVKPHEIGKYKFPKIIIRNSDLDVPFNSRTDQFEVLSKILIHDSNRNRLILKDVIIELNSGKKVVIITERKEHIDSLYQYLKQQYETIKLSGDDNETNRNLKWKTLKSGNYQALITTGQFFGEGSDLQSAECLFLVYPFSFKGKLIQYIGRVQRSEISPTIYDYHDFKIDYLNKLFLKRNTYYRQFEKQKTLFDEPEDQIDIRKDFSEIKKCIRIDFSQLEFRYGSIAFPFVIKETGEQLEFEIENYHIRPEFEVLKSYFAKQLGLKKVSVDIYAEFENHRLVSQMASSEDLDKINSDIIESVKFQFISNKTQGEFNDTPTTKNILDLNKLQSGAGLYSSEEELLKSMLKDKDVKHYKQLIYLVKNHKSSVLKIRFVLHPFSFLFLIEGQTQFHVIMETLDTEEATYIWHINKQDLRFSLLKIDQDLNVIRNKGRQSFLENQPKNFSKIIHDYSDDRKGFVLWKFNIEERLI
jgi:superfamily II DNA or RNA helicase